MTNIKEIISYRDMIWSLVRRELRGKYEKSVLGFLWAFLGPLFQILIYAVIFTTVFHNDMEEYYIFLMSGILPWTFFSESLAQGTTSILGNSEMVKKIYFPREVLVISEVTAKAVNMLLSFIVMAGFLLVSGVGFSEKLVVLPFIVAIEYIFALGVSFFVAAVTVYFRDLEYVINVFLMAWIWGTPIMYTMEGITSPSFLMMLKINPMTNIVLAFQNTLYYKRWTSLESIHVSLLISVVSLIIGYLVFNKLKKRFAEEL